MINRKQLIKKYLDFFKSKNHKIVENASLIPKNDPTVLFTTAGMHPLVPYLLGQKHPQGKRLCSVQRCIRTGDIEEVGDETHHTFFEMLGNWSLGDYWKKQAIEYSFEFLTRILKIPKERISVTYFKGDKDAPRDTESAKIWNSLGIAEKKITPLGKEDNWWGPAGKTGPCGPDTEMFYWKSAKPTPKIFDPNKSTLATGEKSDWVEVWNDVFMQYFKDEKSKYLPIKQKNVDTGMGVERTLTILNNLEDNYLTEVWSPIIKKIEKLSSKEYRKNKEETKAMRIIADHIKAAVFILSEEITPSNTEQGYVLRRLIRRAIRYKKTLNITGPLTKIAEPVFRIYPNYRHIQKNKKQILNKLEEEEEKFNLTLEKGLNQLRKMAQDKTISGKNAFLLYQSYGFPIEMTKEIASKEYGSSVDIKGFQKEQEKHQNLSRTATQGKFKSGLADDSEATKKLHTATHLLLAALRKVLKNKKITQKGSNITPERLRLDFSFPRKLTQEEITETESLVNRQIHANLEVFKKEMSPDKALNQGALGVFGEKYGERVSVYSIGDFSKEICAGPHVANTKELPKLKITKEESSSAGVRRIKAVFI